MGVPLAMRSTDRLSPCFGYLGCPSPRVCLLWFRCAPVRGMTEWYFALRCDAASTLNPALWLVTVLTTVHIQSGGFPEHSLRQAKVVHVDARAVPAGWSGSDLEEGAPSVSDLASLHTGIVGAACVATSSPPQASADGGDGPRKGSSKATAIVFDSIVPLLLLHDQRSVLQFLQRLRQPGPGKCILFVLAVLTLAVSLTGSLRPQTAYRRVWYLLLTRR